MKITGAVLEETGRSRPFAASRPISISELELDPPGETELLIRIEAAGICHSDLSVVDGNRPRPVPMLLGHEAAGVIEHVGEEAAAANPELIAGRRVVMAFLPRCGICRECRTDGRMPCSNGSRSNNAGTLLEGARRLHRGDGEVHHHLGVSGFADHAVVDYRSVVPVGDDVPPDVAAVLGCAVLTGGGAVLNAAAPGPDDDVMVVGLGGVGMAALLTALSLDGASGRRIVAVDALEEKLDRARELGATETFTPQTLDVKADIVIEAAGNPRAFETAVAATAPGGRTITVGLPAPGADSTISPLGLVAEARTIIGSYLGSAVPSRDIPRFEQLWREGRLPVEELVSAHVDLADINAAMDSLADGHAVRQIIKF